MSANTSYERSVLVCKTCQGEPSIGTSRNDKVAEAIADFSSRGKHQGHNIEVRVGHAQNPVYDEMLASTPKGYFIYGEVVLRSR